MEHITKPSSNQEFYAGDDICAFLYCDNNEIDERNSFGLNQTHEKRRAEKRITHDEIQIGTSHSMV